MNRRDFFKLSAALGAGTLFSGRTAGSPITEPGAGIPVGAMTLPENPSFKTKHLIAMVYGNGVRKKDVMDNPEFAPNLARLAKQGVVFSEDYGETANLHGYMYTEVLTGRDAPSQQPRYPTWTEYIRKKTEGKASDFWMLQSLSYYRAWTWDCKHFSKHPEYGLPYGATSLTMNKLFYPENRQSPREMFDLHIEKGLGHTEAERNQIEEFFADVMAGKTYVPPSTREPLINRELQYGDAQSLMMAGQILRAFKPKLINVQILAMDDAHADFGFWDYNTDYWEYVKHIKTTDELIGKLWDGIQADPYFRDTTALVIRPECGRDDEVNIFGQLGHSPGNYYAHYVWMLGIGPDFKKNVVLTDRVQRRDLCPTLTYLMSGEAAEYSTGHVRTLMFKDEYKLPKYVLPKTAEVTAPRKDWFDWQKIQERRMVEKVKALGRSTVGYGD